MSLYKDASLVMIPSAYKDGKLYSIRPTDGDGDFTFSRGSNLAATRVDVNGLIEKGRENLLLQSNSFSNAVWVNNAGSCTRTSGQAGYDGTSDAWLLTQDSVGYDNIIQSVSSSGVNTYSVYAKGSSTAFTLRIANTGDRVLFNLSTGSVASTFGSNLIDYGMTDIGGGWYRCYLTANATITDLNIYPYFNSTTATSVTIQDAQLEQGLVATDYIETGASTAQAGILEDMPRLDYSGSCPSLLLEPQRTNIVSQSEYMQYSNNTNVSVNDNETTSPEGVVNAAEAIPNTTNSNHIVRSNNLAGLTSQGTYSVSVFAKQNGYKYIVVGAGFGSTATPLPTFDLNTGTIVANSSNGTIEDYGNGWYKCTATIQIASTALYPIISILNNSQSGTYAGDGTSAVYLYGHQIEEGSYPTSYIPTYGTSQTRSADNPIISSAGDIIDINQGTLFLDGTIDSNVDTEIYFMKFDGVNFNDTLYLYRSAIGKIQGVYRIAGSAYKEETTGAISGRFKAAFAYDSNNDCTLYVNGSKVGSSFSIPTPSVNLTAIRLGGFNDTLAKQSGLTHQSLYFPTALTDSECIALTTL